MASTKIAITVDKDLLTSLDELVAREVFPNRSKAIQEALRDKLAYMKRSRLARECARLNQAEEKALAEEGISQELRSWPEY